MYKLENFGPFRNLTVELQNPFRNLIYKYRFRKSVQFWNKNVENINKWINTNKSVENYAFKWTRGYN